MFIHWEAADDAKIQQYNYEATKLSIERAVRGEPKAEEVTRQRNSAKHPFAANTNVDTTGEKMATPPPRAETILGRVRFRPCRGACSSDWPLSSPGDEGRASSRFDRGGFGLPSLSAMTDVARRNRRMRP